VNSADVTADVTGGACPKGWQVCAPLMLHGDRSSARSSIARSSSAFLPTFIPTTASLSQANPTASLRLLNPGSSTTLVHPPHHQFAGRSNDQVRPIASWIGVRPC
jgi:hypothetical protein